ncbi:uncharacterized protein LOC113774313 [Coffea eugenioides]|uniref:uncharacterized protein LOC113774313 n=1 Tax=Coffea eugenioides TaxID=49369 RepID=UPI000F60A23C|nr:uncharacterized protein LOC113774313 [Coffea eugenioides]
MAKELFNYRHSSLRNIIERTFRVLKRRFAILREAVLNYTMTAQLNIVIAYCAVHNFIFDEHPDNTHFVNPDEAGPDVNGAILPYPDIQPLHADPQAIQEWWTMRDALAEGMFAIYRRHN